MDGSIGDQSRSSSARTVLVLGLTAATRAGPGGGSNGGLLTGNMLVRSPELFGAIVCQVPLLDMLVLGLTAATRAGPGGGGTDSGVAPSLAFAGGSGSVATGSGLGGNFTRLSTPSSPARTRRRNARMSLTRRSLAARASRTSDQSSTTAAAVPRSDWSFRGVVEGPPRP